METKWKNKFQKENSD